MDTAMSFYGFAICYEPLIYQDNQEGTNQWNFGKCHDAASVYVVKL